MFYFLYIHRMLKKNNKNKQCRRRLNRPEPRTNWPAANFPVGPIIIGFNCVYVYVCGHKRFDLLYHLCYVVFFMLFTSSVWFALSEIFLLIGSNNNNHRKKKNKNHRDNNGQRNDHVPYTCRALSSRHRHTHSYRWPRLRRIYTYFSLSICSVRRRLLLFVDQLFNEIDALFVFLLSIFSTTLSLYF